MAPGENITDLYTLLSQPAPDPRETIVRDVATQASGYLRDLETLTAGWRARDWIEQHAQEQGVVFGEGAEAVAPCKPCARYAVALLRGQPEAEALKLACDQLREMRQRTLAAVGLVEVYCRVGGVVSSGGWRQFTGIKVGVEGSPWVEYEVDPPLMVPAGQTLVVLGLGERSISLRVAGEEVVRALRPTGGEGLADE